MQTQTPPRAEIVKPAKRAYWPYLVAIVLLLVLVALIALASYRCATYGACIYIPTPWHP